MDIGWFAGWVEQSAGDAPGTYAFALNMDMPGGMEEAPRRRAAVERALREIGALPPQS
jgi:beta-lactamase class D